MKKKVNYKVALLFLVSCVTFASIGLSSPAIAEDDVKSLLDDTPIEVSADTAIYSKYIWRGFKLDDDPVTQTGAYISGYGFEAGVWSSFDINPNDALASDEVDYFLGYTYDLNEVLKVPLSISGGYTYYDFPATDLNSQESYLGISLDTILSPAITWYHDFEDEDKGGGKGDYVVAEISHSIEVPNMPVTLDLSGHVGFNHELFIVGDGGDAGFGAGLTFQLSKNSTLSPNVCYSIPFGDLEDESDGNQDNEFYGGAILAFSF